MEKYKNGIVKSILLTLWTWVAIFVSIAIISILAGMYLDILSAISLGIVITVLAGYVFFEADLLPVLIIGGFCVIPFWLRRWFLFPTEMWDNIFMISGGLALFLNGIFCAFLYKEFRGKYTEKKDD